MHPEPRIPRRGEVGVFESEGAAEALPLAADSIRRTQLLTVMLPPLIAVGWKVGNAEL